MEIEKSVYLKVDCGDFDVSKAIEGDEEPVYSISLGANDVIEIENDSRIDLLIEALQLLRKEK